MAPREVMSKVMFVEVVGGTSRLVSISQREICTVVKNDLSVCECLKPDGLRFPRFIYAYVPYFPLNSV